MVLTSKIRKKFEAIDNHALKLAIALGKSECTAKRVWKANKDLRLSSRKVVDLLIKETGLTEDEILHETQTA